jgi:predicted nuclease with TOPRIM domain
VLTVDNIALFVVAVAVALAVAALYDRLHQGSMDYRESRVEGEVRLLRQRVEALQTTIDLMSSRILELQRENERLKNELARLVPFGAWRATEPTALRKALERLTEDEFNSLTYDSFRSIYEGFTTEQSLNRKRQALLEYAEKQSKLDLLRSAILAINPAAFG